MATVFKGTGATDQEIKTWQDNLSSSQSPEQLKKGVDELLQLMNGRLKAIDDQWTSSMGTTRDFHILSPQSEQILHKLGADYMVQADGANVRQAPQGGAAAAAPPAAAPKVGDVGTVNGQKIRVIGYDAKGNVQGVPVP
jgi:hypothetical protein